MKRWLVIVACFLSLAAFAWWTVQRGPLVRATPVSNAGWQPAKPVIRVLGQDGDLQLVRVADLSLALDRDGKQLPLPMNFVLLFKNAGASIFVVGEWRMDGELYVATSRDGGATFELHRFPRPTARVVSGEMTGDELRISLVSNGDDTLEDGWRWSWQEGHNPFQLIPRPERKVTIRSRDAGRTWRRMLWAP